MVLLPSLQICNVPKNQKKNELCLQSNPIPLPLSFPPIRNAQNPDPISLQDTPLDHLHLLQPLLALHPRAADLYLALLVISHHAPPPRLRHRVLLALLGPP